MSFRRRPYPEILDGLLTSIVGGVASEVHPSPNASDGTDPAAVTLKSDNVSQVLSIWGSRNGESYQFKNGTDFVLSNDRKTIQWNPKGTIPDPATLLYINYRTTGADSPVSDVSTGSVVRTLSEAISLEMAQVYANMEMVYRSAFIDSAEGSSLDKVVALLGVARVRGGRPAGKVEFTRASGSTGIISIPAGTRICDIKGNVQYETIEEVVMQQMQNLIIASVRDLETNDPVPASTLTVIPNPIAGVASVTNPSPTAITVKDETDDQLRTRAKTFLHGSERATRGAIIAALSNQGVAADIEEPDSAPGTIVITLRTESLDPETETRVQAAVAMVKPAGVHITWGAHTPPVVLDITVKLITTKTLVKAEMRSAHQKLTSYLSDYITQLPRGTDPSLTKIASLALEIPGVNDCNIMSASINAGDTVTEVLSRDENKITLNGEIAKIGTITIIDPNLPTTITVVIKMAVGSPALDSSVLTSVFQQKIASLNNALISSPGSTEGNLEYNSLVTSLKISDPSKYTFNFICTKSNGVATILDSSISTSYSPQAGEQYVLETITVVPEKTS